MEYARYRTQGQVMRRMLQINHRGCYLCRSPRGFLKQAGSGDRLVGGAGRPRRSALGFAFWLGNHTVKRRRRQETATHHANAAQRVSRIGPTMPAMAAIMAL